MNLFDLVAKITLDSSEYDKGIQSAGEGTSALSSKWGKFGKLAKTVGVAAVAATTAAAAGVAKLTKASVEAYANYEQLEGGVKKLYGSAADELMNYANNAYKTSGMSANQYMEQATSFSAALINSLGGDTSEAAKRTDVAMRAIADNFNTFGGDIELIQGAFQGFAKQNYAMLDNLKLGYGGTKTEMERLISDANAYAESIGQAGDLSIDSFSDIVTAIDLVQQKQGIAGATAAEANKTIEGSVMSLKASWENLVAGFANPDADVGALAEDVMTRLGIAASNVIPAISNAMSGIGEALTTMLPQIVEKIPQFFETVVAPLAQTGAQMVMSLIGGIAKNLPQMIVSGLNALTSFVQGIGSGESNIIASAGKIIISLVTGLVKALPQIVVAAGRLVIAIVEAIVTAIPQIAEAGWKATISLAKSIVSGVSKLASAGQRLSASLTKSIIDGIKSLPGKVAALAKKIPTAIKNGLGSLKNIGTNLVQGLWNGIKSKFTSVTSLIKSLASKLPKAVKVALGIASPSKVMAEIGKWIPEGLAVGIERNVKSVRRATDKMAESVMFDPNTVTSKVVDVNDSSQSNSAPSTGNEFVINLNYDASSDANDMVRDIARGLNRYKMAGVF